MADIKSVNTKLICNGEDLAKKLDVGKADLEAFAKNASKEIVIPVVTRTPVGETTPNIGKPPTSNIGTTAALKAVGKELLGQVATPGDLDFSILDGAIHTAAAGLSMLGPAGIATGVTLELLGSVAKKTTSWLNAFESNRGKSELLSSGLLQDDPLRSPFAQGLKARAELVALAKDINSQLATTQANLGKSPEQIQLAEIERKLIASGDRSIESAQALTAARKAVAAKLESESRIQAPLVQPFNPVDTLGKLSLLESRLGLTRSGSRALAGASSIDSVEGVSAVLRAQQTQGVNSVEERLVRFNERIEENTRKQANDLAALLDVMKNKPGITAALLSQP